VAHAWAKVSDNFEADGNSGSDSDGLVILRVTAAALNLPSDGAATGGTPWRNAVVTLEAWLKRREDGSLAVISLREVTP